MKTIVGILALWFLGSSLALSSVRIESEYPADEQGRYACAGDVTFFVSFPADTTDEKELTAVWRRPDGEVQENAVIQHDFSQASAKDVFFWLRFDEPSSLEGDFFGARREEVRKYHGEWTFALFEKDRKIDEAVFSVHCLVP